MKDMNNIFEQLKKFNPQAIILFGSASRREMGKDSDLDILLIKKTDKSFQDRMREARMSVRTNLPLDIIVLTPKEAREFPKRSTFFSQIIEEGKLIYGRV